MRIFRSIVQSFALPMLHARQDLTFGRSITLQFICDDHSWHVVQPFEEFAEKSFRRLFVVPALHQDIEHVAVLIDDPPERVGFAVDFQVHHVQMPYVSATRTAATQFVGICLPKCEAPLLKCCDEGTWMVSYLRREGGNASGECGVWANRSSS